MSYVYQDNILIVNKEAGGRKMNIEIKDLEKKDYDTARKFAITGMNLTRYTEKKWELYFYSKYFLYLELSRSTQILGAYMDDKLVGVLLADMSGELKKINSIWYKIYVGLMKIILNIGYRKNAGTYDIANKEMLSHFKDRKKPYGELIFFVVDPVINGKGIGSKLLKELQRREENKLIYLFTDSGCTYPFYDKKGFTREEDQSIEIKVHNKQKYLTCFLYSKRL